MILIALLVAFAILDLLLLGFLLILIISKFN